MTALPSVLGVDRLTVVRGGRRLVDDVSLHVRPGEFVAVVGPNGAGKSSLLKGLTGEIAASGEVRLFGRPPATWPRLQLAVRMAVMPQSAQLSFAFTVRQVIGLGRLPHKGCSRQENDAVVDRILAELELRRMAGQSYLTLSGGERQRVHFGRALAQLAGTADRTLLLLDEPTSALDLAQQKSVLDRARELATCGATVLAVLHDLNLVARYADRVLVMVGGRSVHDCPIDQAFDADSLSAAFGAPIAVETARCDQRPIALVRRT